MARTFATSGESVILYDDQKLSQISPDDFDPSHWPDTQSAPGQAGRHGAVCFIQDGERDWVLRHYYRGGLVGRLLRDQYLWTGRSSVRCVREWDLLRAMVDEGLPAPAPVAAHFMRTGFWYRADLITERIPDTRPLTAAGRALDKTELWRSVGWCIARFHARGFCHADLNAHNILVDDDANVWLLDWDRGTRRVPGGWRQGNLARLKRSCEKLRGVDFAFGDAQWQALLGGYQEMAA